MTKTSLSYDRVKAILDAYGADPAHWPEAERAEMKRAVSGLAEFAALREEQAGLDRLLNQDRVEPDTATLEARILASAPRPAAQVSRGRVRGRIPAFAAIASLVAGSLLGFATAASTVDRDTAAENLLADAFAEPGSAALYLETEV